MENAEIISAFLLYKKTTLFLIEPFILCGKRQRKSRILSDRKFVSVFLFATDSAKMLSFLITYFIAVFL